MKKFFVLFLILFFCVFSVSAVYASAWENAQTNLKAGGSAAYGDTPELPVVIGNIVTAVLGVLGIVLIYIIIHAGYKYMMAQGVKEDAQKAKQSIVNAIIGLVIVFLAYAISTYVVGKLVVAVSAS